MTAKNKDSEEVTYSRETFLEHKAKLDEAWKEVDDCKTKINRLDIEVANLKDENGKLEIQKQNMLNNFRELYTMHSSLIEVVSGAISAHSITSGKLAEALAKFRFVIPETTQQNQIQQ